MDLQKVITGLLSQAYKTENGRIAEILEQTDENAILQDLLNLDRDRISKLNPVDGKTKFQEGYAKAKKEVRAQFESELKDAYGIDSESEGFQLQGKELIDHIVSEKSAEAAKSAGGAKMSDEEIRVSPAYRKMEKELRDNIRKMETDHATAVEKLEGDFNAKQTTGSARSIAMQKLADLKPILPKDAKKAATLQNLFSKELFDGVEVRSEGDGFILMKDGKRLDDGHGNPVNFEDYVKAKADDFFEFAENNGGGNSGNNNNGDSRKPQGGNGGSAGGAGKAVYPEGLHPKSFDEYSTMVRNKEIKLEDRQAVQKAWTEENGRD